MIGDRHNVIAYLATLAAIVALALAGAAVCMFGNAGKHLAEIVGALSFIGAAITGLIGVIGTFRPKGPPVAATQSRDVNVGSDA